MYTFEQVLPLIKPSYGKLCCRKRVGYYHSLSVDFGERIYHHQKRNVDPFYGEWQFRTYNRMWRITRDEHVILEGQNNTGTNDELDEALQQIEFGRVVNISISKQHSLTLKLDNGLSIDFLISDREEDICTIFLPNNRYLTYTCNQVWEYDTSDMVDKSS